MKAEEKDPYANMTDEDFDRILEDHVAKLNAAALLAIPGIYEILSEELNNSVLEAWEQEQDANPDEDEPIEGNDKPCAYCGATPADPRVAWEPWGCLVICPECKAKEMAKE